MKDVQVYFVLGGPGSGKGTQCSLLQKELGLHHISAGDCLREERNKPNSAYGNLINTYIKEGSIVPVEITCSLLRNRMKELCATGTKFIIDGFPRNQNNYEGWNDMMKDVVVPFCVHLDCPQDMMKNRLLKRGEQSNRVDDNLESIVKRFRTYTTETIPIITLFESQGRCRCIDGSRSIEEVYQDIRKLFL